MIQAWQLPIGDVAEERFVRFGKIRAAISIAITETNSGFVSAIARVPDEAYPPPELTSKVTDCWRDARKAAATLSFEDFD